LTNTNISEEVNSHNHQLEQQPVEQEQPKKKERKPVLPVKYTRNKVFAFCLIKKLMNDGIINEEQFEKTCSEYLHIYKSVEEQKTFFKEFEEQHYKPENKALNEKVKQYNKPIKPKKTPAKKSKKNNIVVEQVVVPVPVPPLEPQHNTPVMNEENLRLYNQLMETQKVVETQKKKKTNKKNAVQIEPVVQPEPEPEPVVQPVQPEPEPEPVVQPEPEPEPVAEVQPGKKKNTKKETTNATEKPTTKPKNTKNTKKNEPAPAPVAGRSTRCHRVRRRCATVAGTPVGGGRRGRPCERGAGDGPRRRRRTTARPAARLSSGRRR
jgi:hypothetical protein